MFERTLLMVAAVAAFPVAGSAQSRPDFSGEWTRVDSSAEQRSVVSVGDGAFRVGNMGSGWGSPLTLRQQGNRLVVEYTQFSTYDLQPKLVLTFALDGSETRNTINIGHADEILRSRAAWRDNTLVITTIYPAPDGTTEVRQALSLESPTSLIVETARAGRSGTAPTVIRTTYRKS